MNINTIIFDLDGTLLNTLSDISIAINYALKAFHYPQRSEEEIKSFVGNGIKKAIERAIEKEIDNKELLKIIELFKTYYKEHANINTQPYKDIIPMLRYLKQNGYKTGVVSNKYDEAVKKLCKNYFGDLIDTAIGETPETGIKPNPKGIIKAVKTLNSNLKETIYTGDSEVDIETAKNAGIKCISVLWGFKDEKFLKLHGGYLFAKTPNDIIKIIEKKIYLS